MSFEPPLAESPQFVFNFPRWAGPEASSCRSAIRAAQAVVEDLGEGTASRSGGLVDLSRCSQANSERDLNVVVRRYSLQLSVPLTNLPKPPGVRYNGDFRALSLKDWCQFLVDYNMWHLMVGLRRPDARRERAILTEFWRRYRLSCPDHQIWQTFEQFGVDPASCAPMLLHGDEGRGRKKAPFLVCSYHSVLGFGTLAANEARRKRPFLQMRLNYSESSHVTRLLTAVLPKMHKDEMALKEICKFITKDALHMVRTGIQSCHGGTFHMAVLSATGDWAWLAKSGNLSRSYSTVEKRPRGARSAPRGICHYCRAGQANVPFEDFRRNPVWKATCFEVGDAPWFERPIFLDIPHEPSRPAFFSGLTSGIPCTWGWERCCVPAPSL